MPSANHLMEILSPDYSPSDLDVRQFADVTQIAELMMRQLTHAKNLLWMESAVRTFFSTPDSFKTKTRIGTTLSFIQPWTENAISWRQWERGKDDETDGDRL